MHEHQFLFKCVTAWPTQTSYVNCWSSSRKRTMWINNTFNWESCSCRGFPNDSQWSVLSTSMRNTLTEAYWTHVRMNFVTRTYRFQTAEPVSPQNIPTCVTIGKWMIVAPVFKMKENDIVTRCALAYRLFPTYWSQFSCVYTRHTLRKKAKQSENNNKPNTPGDVTRGREHRGNI